MLYDPKWQMEVKPTLAGFAAWLGRQPADEKICVSNANDCALARYYASMGRQPLLSIMCEISHEMNVSGVVLYDIVGIESAGTNRTYGEAYGVARRYLPK
jgi:hypothetical protein